MDFSTKRRQMIRSCRPCTKGIWTRATRSVRTFSTAGDEGKGVTSTLVINDSLLDTELRQFQQSVRKFFRERVEPNQLQWDKDGIVPRSCWEAAGELGLLGCTTPPSSGGPGVDFRYAAVVVEEQARALCSGPGFSIHSDIVMPYVYNYGSQALQDKYLPNMVAGKCIGAIAMTEPGTGSDLQGIRTTARPKDGSPDTFIINGQKTFISNGQHADVVLVVARTAPTKLSIFAVDTSLPGFERGRNLQKIGAHAQDTSELSFTDVEVHRSQLVGDDVGLAFKQMMQQLPRERLVIAIQAVGGAAGALERTVQYVQEREAFGQRIADFQWTRFMLAQMKTEVCMGAAFVRACVESLIQPEGSDAKAKGLGNEDAAMAKSWTTAMQNRVINQCVQMHGGYGFMSEYPVARAYCDARVTPIYGGTNEIMWEIIARSMGLDERKR